MVYKKITKTPEGLLAVEKNSEDIRHAFVAYGLVYKPTEEERIL